MVVGGFGAAGGGGAGFFPFLVEFPALFVVFAGVDCFFFGFWLLGLVFVFLGVGGWL